MKTSLNINTICMQYLKCDPLIVSNKTPNCVSIKGFYCFYLRVILANNRGKRTILKWIAQDKSTGKAFGIQPFPSLF
jgi:hypothetical protein